MELRIIIKLLLVSVKFISGPKMRTGNRFRLTSHTHLLTAEDEYKCVDYEREK